MSIWALWARSASVRRIGAAYWPIICDRLRSVGSWMAWMSTILPFDIVTWTWTGPNCVSTVGPVTWPLAVDPVAGFGVTAAFAGAPAAAFASPAFGVACGTTGAIVASGAPPSATIDPPPRTASPWSDGVLKLKSRTRAVSYTHLTLPTNREV